MTVLAAIANGNFTSASTWGIVDSTSYLDSEASSTALTTSYVSSANVTPGAITVDGVGVKIGARNTTTGTMTVQLYNSTGAVDVANVTINTADIPLSSTSDQAGGWVFFKFASPVLLLAATNYQVRALVSSASSITLFRNATAGNWSRYLRRTTTQAPAAGDDVIITAEHTGTGTKIVRSVTMDSTAATDYGSAATANTSAAVHISTGGILSYGTTASTNYVMRISGNLQVYANGIFNMGSVGAEIPRNSTAILEFDCAADGDFGLIMRNLANVSIQGLSRTSGKSATWCYLNTDEAIASTSLGVDTDTGWLDNDVIVVTTTTRTVAQSEAGALNGAAGASTLTVDGFAGAGGGLAFAHSGTTPFAAEVGLITRNVIVRAVTSTFTTFVMGSATCTFDADWAQFQYMGSSGGTNKYGINLVPGAGGVNSVNYCSITDFEYSAIYISPTSTGVVDVSNNVIWKGTSGTSGSYGIFIFSAITSTNTYNNNLIIGWTGGPTYGIFVSGTKGPITNSAIVGCQYGLFWSSKTEVVSGTANAVSNVVIHGGCSRAFYTNLIPANIVIHNLRTIRNSIGISMVDVTSQSAGMVMANGVFSDFLSLGDTTGIQYAGTNGMFARYFFRNPIVSGDTTFSMTDALNFDSGHAEMIFENPKFSLATGYYTIATNRDIMIGNGGFFSYRLMPQITMRNPTLGATTTMAGNLDLMALGSYIKLHTIAGNTYNYKTTWGGNNISQSNTSVAYGSENVSEQLIPQSANVKFESSPCKVQVNSGTTANISVRIYKLNTYNGNEPRLILKSNYLMTGNASDLVMNTFSGSTNTWVEVTCTTPTAGENGVFTFVVDIDGTAGSVNIGRWAVS